MSKNSSCVYALMNTASCTFHHRIEKHSVTCDRDVEIVICECTRKAFRFLVPTTLFFLLITGLGLPVRFCNFSFFLKMAVIYVF